MYYVYVHTVPNGKMYIGSTKDLEYRWNSGKGYENNKPFYEDIKNYGWENIKHEIVAEYADRETASRLETALIVLMKTENDLYGYNQTSIAENALTKYQTRKTLNTVKLKRGLAEENFLEASGFPISVCNNMIDEWIFNAMHRDICKDRLINGYTYEVLSKKYEKSVRQLKNIVFNCCVRLEDHF